MVIIFVFAVNILSGPLTGVEIWNFPQLILDIFLTGGLAIILFTCMVGQLSSQVNASHYMLDYFNNYFGIFTLYIANLIGFSGLLHAAYVVQFFVGKLTG